MLQPLVENAVRHGIGPKPSGGTVEIIACRSGEGVLITVRDNGVGMEETKRVQLEQAKSHGVGIANVNRRLQMIYGHKLEMSSALDQGTQIKLYLPEEIYYAQSNSNR